MAALIHAAGDNQRGRSWVCRVGLGSLVYEQADADVASA